MNYSKIIVKFNITKQNLENYFQNAYGTRPKVVKKKSTRLKQTPLYKK